MVHTNFTMGCHFSLRRSLLLVLLSLAATQRATAEEHKFMGTGSCSSSVCHGSTSARKGVILHNEYVTWSKQDFHSKAWSNLVTEEGKRIGHHLGIENPESDALCLSCHATTDRETQTPAPHEQLKDGVGCESCHGAAEGYLKTHTQEGATHKGNLENGLKDIFPVDNRAKLCLSCHLGDDSSFVSHRLIGAGHPRLTFELDTFGIAQPHHWEVDADYIKRKGEYNPIQAWLIGQIVRTEEMVKASSSPTRATHGKLPELTQYYCYNCHHSLLEKQWKKREYNGKPGELQVNVSSALIAREGLSALDAEQSAVLDSALLDLQSGGKDSLERLNEVKLQAMEKKYSKEDAQKILKKLISFAKAHSTPPYEVAEQIAMGTTSVLSFLDPDGRSYGKEIKKLYQTLRTPETFNPEEFLKVVRECEQF